MALLPAVADGDIDAFGAALTQIQEITGRWFAPVQGGTFAPGPSEALVRRMREWGASGVGQSSWGPAVYGIVAEKRPALAWPIGCARRTGHLRGLRGSVPGRWRADLDRTRPSRRPGRIVDKLMETRRLR